MSIKNGALLGELKTSLKDYANHIDFFVKRVASTDNIKLYNSHNNSESSESICVQATIYKIYQDYCEKLIDFDSPVPEIPQLIDTEVMVKNINKKSIPRFIKQNDLSFPFFALLFRANPHSKEVTFFEEKKFMQDFIRKSEIKHIKRVIQYDLNCIESYEKGTWKTIRDNKKNLDSLKF